MSQQFKTVITSEHKLFDLHLKETFQYRDLIFLFVKRDFSTLYKQTILGPLWAIIQPLFTTVIFTIIFGSLAGLDTTDIAGDFVLPGFLFYMSGNICWSYFSTTLNSISKTFIANRNTMGKVYFPRLATPIATAFSGLISFGIQFALFFVMWLFYVIRGGTSICVSPMLLLLPVTIVEMIILAVGCGIIVSAATTKYRDLALAVGFCLQLWQYGSPIAYGLTMVSGKIPHLMWLYMLNPVTPIITTIRYSVFGFGYFNIGYYLLSWGISIALFVVGLIMFSRIERTFMDTI